MDDELAVGASRGVGDLHRETLGRQIATTVAREILSGVIAAGTSLSQEELSVRFDTSRMPVRDALQELVSAGYLVRGRGNQLRVSHLRPEDVEDAMDLQATLNGLISRRATERATEAELAELERLHHQMVAAAARRDGAAVSDLNRQFHMLTYRMSRSPRLVAFHRAATLHIAWRFYADHPELCDRCNEQHAEILEAMHHRDGARVEALMIEHTGLSRYIRSIHTDAHGGGDSAPADHRLVATADDHS